MRSYFFNCCEMKECKILKTTNLLQNNHTRFVFACTYINWLEKKRKRNMNVLMVSMIFYKKNYIVLALPQYLFTFFPPPCSFIILCAINKRKFEWHSALCKLILSGVKHVYKNNEQRGRALECKNVEYIDLFVLFIYNNNAFINLLAF